MSFRQDRVESQGKGNAASEADLYGNGKRRVPSIARQMLAGDDDGHTGGSGQQQSQTRQKESSAAGAILREAGGYSWPKETRLQ